MRMGLGKVTAEIRFTDEEKNGIGDRALVHFDPKSEDAWLVLETHAKGRAISPINDGSMGHPWRLSMSAKHFPNVPQFGMEDVERELLNFGRMIKVRKPAMDRPLRSVNRSFSPHNKGKPSPLAIIPNADDVRKAVGVINELKRVYGDALEITINKETGFVEVRMILEFGA